MEDGERAVPAEPILLARVPGAYDFYRYQCVAINVWRSQPDARAVEVLAQLTEQSLSACPTGLASIHWLEEGVGLPTAEARQGLGAIARRYDRHLVCVGVMLRGSGFWASAVRSALSGVVLLAPRSYALRFFGEATDLANFVCGELAKRGTPSPASDTLVSVMRAALEDAIAAPTARAVAR